MYSRYYCNSDSISSTFWNTLSYSSGLWLAWWKLFSMRNDLIFCTIRMYSKNFSRTSNWASKYWLQESKQRAYSVRKN